MFNRKLITTLITATALGGIAIGANAASVNGFANAVIQTPLSIAENVEMNFGTIAPDAAGGVVTLDTANGLIAPANFVLGGGQLSGQFTVTGEGGQQYAISFPNASETLTLLPAGPDTMSLGSFTTSIVATPATPRTIPGGAGLQTDSFTVGGQLTVGAGQAPGTYRGTYTVQVDYQ